MLRRKTIGLIINDIDGNYLTILWLIIKKTAEKFNCNLIVFEGRSLMSQYGVDGQHNIIYEFINKNILDGLIISGTISGFTTKDIYIDFVNRYRYIPLVSLSQIIPGVTSLVYENKIGIKCLIDHLIKDHGYKRIIFVKGPEGNGDAEERFEAYQEALKENNIELNQKLIFNGDFTSRTAYRIMSGIVETNMEYDAIVCANDDMALGAMKYLRDLSTNYEFILDKKFVICGFDNSQNASLAKPPLTTVRQPMDKMCQKAFEVLVKKMNGEQVDEIIKLPTELITRESCGCKNKYDTDEIISEPLRLVPVYRFHEYMHTYDLKEFFKQITILVQKCCIRSCFISTYKEGTVIYDYNSIIDNSLVLPEMSNLIYSYYNYQEVDISKFECSFITKGIVPEKFLPTDRRFTYLVNPLFFGHEHFGFIVFEVDNDDALSIEPLRGQISNTLKGALMLIEREKIEKDLMETERLAALGQLIGGIAHNVLTPIMSISGMCNIMEDLANEYKDSIGNKDVTDDDHIEIAEELLSRIESVRDFTSYISEVISKVKNQAVQLNNDETSDFSVSDLVNQIEFFINNNERLESCHTSVDADCNAIIKGDIGNIILIVTNLLMNAVQAYNEDEENKKIELDIKNIEDKVQISVQDYGKGIPDLMKTRIFKTMFTTKGKHGTGLSLMLSYSTIIGKFAGEMWFESESDKGSVFYISLPCYKID